MKLVWFLCLLLLCGITPAQAQMLQQMSPQMSSQLPYFHPQRRQQQQQQQQQMNPEAYAYEAQAQVFPALPPSRACTAKDMAGVWKLLLVFEKPAGPDMTDFMSDPEQYLLFNTNGTYGRLNAGHQAVPPYMVRRAVARGLARTLEQYVVDSSGFIYFYRDGQAIDTQACFIVAVQQDPFSPGQMLLMPPEGQSKVRLLRVYARVNEQPARRSSNRRRY